MTRWRGLNEGFEIGVEGSKRGSMHINQSFCRSKVQRRRGEQPATGSSANLARLTAFQPSTLQIFRKMAD